VENCTLRTLEFYEETLGRFLSTTGLSRLDEASPLLVQRHLSGLRERIKPVTVHKHFRALKTFFGWCAEAGLLSEHPMRGLTMRAPKTLPRVPEDEEVRALLHACPDTFEGRRNKALIALLADSGLRISEALRLRVEDVNFATRTLSVRGGKGQKDGLASSAQRPHNSCGDGWASAATRGRRIFCSLTEAAAVLPVIAAPTFRTT
jgi:site-specific recombinase XerD